MHQRGRKGRKEKKRPIARGKEVSLPGPLSAEDHLEGWAAGTWLGRAGSRVPRLLRPEGQGGADLMHAQVYASGSLVWRGKVFAPDGVCLVKSCGWVSAWVCVGALVFLLFVFVFLFVSVFGCTCVLFLLLNRGNLLRRSFSFRV